jgi:hypothetical protein
MKNAKIAFNAIDYIIKLLIIIMSLVALVVILRAGMKTDFKTEELSISTFYNRLYFSPSINYADTITGKMQPGVIDLEKFSKLQKSSELEREISFGKLKNPMGAKITIFDSGNKEIASYTYNQGQGGYDELKSRSYAFGAGATTEKIYSLPVVIKNQDSLVNGRIEYDIISQNS